MTLNAHTIGSKYEQTQGLDVADIAKMIRSDIKAARKSGKLPAKLKTSVKIDRYSGGCSIDVRVKGGTDGTVVNHERIDAEVVEDRARRLGLGGPEAWRLLPRHSPHGQDILDTLKSIVDSYNFDNSDSMTDYYHVRYYDNVAFSQDLINEQRMARHNCPVARVCCEVKSLFLGCFESHDDYVRRLQSAAVRLDQLMETTDDPGQRGELDRAMATAMGMLH